MVVTGNGKYLPGFIHEAEILPQSISEPLECTGVLMPHIISAAHAFPPHTVPQEAVKEIVSRVFADTVDELERLLTVFDNSRIDNRQFMMPLEWYQEPRSQLERTSVYQKQGLKLIEEAAHACLARAGCRPDEVDQVIFVSSTGHATPTLDARLINRLGMRPDTSRLPVWGLGCAAGAVGLSRANDYCLAWPGRRVLLVALECCSLTFMAGDVTKKNLIATSLFADGAAAVLVGGDLAGGCGPSILATRSHLFPDSYRIMGWDFQDDGMQLVLSPKLPLIVRQELSALVGDFLAGYNMNRDDLVHFITHPGGARVVDAYREALRLADEDLRQTEDVLRQHGNMSSVSVLVVLEQWLAAGGMATAGHGLLSAFGPGFSAELLLFKV
jgi:alkylresorcinol/alkylpyrone synthase